MNECCSKQYVMEVIKVPYSILPVFLVLPSVDEPDVLWKYF